LGFRPFIFRLAQELGIKGRVSNSARGVEVLCQGTRVREFTRRIRTDAPPLAAIAQITVEHVRNRRFPDFRIGCSGRHGPGQDLEVLPDLATCPDCRTDFTDPGNRRAGYAFTNCTQCGPRYSIITGLPYDRPLTTMRQFQMCPACQGEYANPADRRFHAQPNACPRCGPKLRLLDRRGRELAGAPLERAARAIAKGRIVAVKGIGGFQLACDARNARTVARLRRRKDRPTKPLALMCADMAGVRLICSVSREAERLLVSPAAPIVLLPKSDRLDRSDRSDGLLLAAPNSPRLGVMLAYSPLHHLLFDRLGRDAVLVMTSCNRRDEPIATTAEDVLASLADIADLVLDHDRPIANRCDDSVVLAGRPRPAGRTGRTPQILVRRSRGYAPAPVRLAPMFHVKHPVLALGGELQVYFGLARERRCFVSPYIGRLESPKAERFLLDTLARYRRWTGIEPAVVACDLHPDYETTRLAERLARRLPLVRVQHHYAHVLSAMAELGVAGPVLGLAFDGTGYGLDGAIWGSEFILVRKDLSWKRLAHLAYRQLTETAAGIADPGQVAAAYLLQTLGEVPSGLALARQAGSAKTALDQGRSTPSSSMGRLFDAVAAITGVCRRATYEGEPAVALETAAGRADASYRLQGTSYRSQGADQKLQVTSHGLQATSHKSRASGCVLLDPDPMLRRVVADTLSGVPAPEVAHRFHLAVVRAATGVAADLAQANGVNTVFLTGGVFQNSILRGRIAQLLEKRSLRVLWPAFLPMNDGGLVLGQAVAAGRRTA